MEDPSSHLGAFLATRPEFRAQRRQRDSVLPSRYAELAPQRASDPAAFRASVQWWASLLSSAAWNGGGGGEDEGRDGGVRAKWDGGAGTTTRGEKGKAREVDRLCVTVDEAMLEQLTLEDVGRPLGIGTVLLELERTSRAMPLRDFLAASSPVYGPEGAEATLLTRLTRMSIAGMAKAALGGGLGWAASQVGLGRGGGGGASGGGGGSGRGGGRGYDEEESQGERDWRRAKRSRDWLLWDNLERASRAVLAAHFANPKLSALECLFSPATFRSELLAPLESSGDLSRLSDNDVRVLLCHLARDRGVAQVSRDGKVIKLARAEGERPAAINETDEGVVSLRNTHASLEAQIGDIERRMEEYTAKAKASLRVSQKTLASSYLASRRALDALLTRRASSLANVHAAVVGLERAAGDAELVESYETASRTLRGVLSDPRLGRERVESSMAGLEEALADQREISEAIQLGEMGVRRAANGGEEVEVDDEEIERELEALRLEQEGEAREAEAKAKEAEAARSAGQEQQQQQHVLAREEMAARAVPGSANPPKPTPAPETASDRFAPAAVDPMIAVPSLPRVPTLPPHAQPSLNDVTEENESSRDAESQERRDGQRASEPLQAE